MLAIGLALGAAACLAWAAFSNQWLVNGSRVEQYGFGLRTAYTCTEFRDEHGCESTSNSEYVSRMRDFGPSAARNTSSAFAPMGWATLVELLAAAAGLFAAAAIALAKKRPDLPLQPTTVTLLGLILSLITGCVFVATKPGEAGFVGAGPAFWIFGAGAVVGIAAAQMLARVNRPVDPDLMADAMDPEQY
jgi:hypothetical protein